MPLRRREVPVRRGKVLDPGLVAQVANEVVSVQCGLVLVRVDEDIRCRSGQQPLFES